MKKKKNEDIQLSKAYKKKNSFIKLACKDRNKQRGTIVNLGRKSSCIKRWNKDIKAKLQFQLFNRRKKNLKKFDKLVKISIYKASESMKKSI